MNVGRDPGCIGGLLAVRSGAGVGRKNSRRDGSLGNGGVGWPGGNGDAWTWEVPPTGKQKYSNEFLAPIGASD